MIPTDRFGVRSDEGPLPGAVSHRKPLTGWHEAGMMLPKRYPTMPCPSRSRISSTILFPGAFYFALGVGFGNIGGCGEPETCGNAVLDPGEACDLGADNRDDATAKPGDCTLTCQRVPTAGCGDGVVQGGEACDRGAENRAEEEALPGDCTDICELVVGGCGDGFIDELEACDDGTANKAPAAAEIGDCTTKCLIAKCGDGMINVGEKCDDANSDDADGCSACQLIVCGDGVKQANEACDEGGSNGDDKACTLDCKLAACGDGLVGPNEECDDGNEVDIDGCSDDCWLPRTVFVTQSYLAGDLAGLDGADSLCQMEADAASLVGMYQAWLSDSAQSPATRFGSTSYAGWYVSPDLDATKIARGWAGLTSGSLKGAIVVPADGQVVGMVDQGVWTNTRPDGQIDELAVHCANWTSKSVDEEGRAGLSKIDQTDAMWTEWIATDCSSPLHLYCFQVAR